MKRIALALCATLATACASTGSHPQPHTAVINSQAPEWQPPTAFDFSWQDQGHHRDPQTPTPVITPEQEERSYQESVGWINIQIKDEQLKLLMVQDTYGKGSAYYRSYLIHLCQVDMLIDTRSGHHPKPYCQK